MEILILIAAIAVAVLVTYLVLKPKFKIKLQQDEQTRRYNEELKRENDDLLSKKNNISKSINSLTSLLEEAEYELSKKERELKVVDTDINKKMIQQASLEAQIQEETNSISNLRKQADDYAANLYDSAIKSAQENIEIAMEKLGEKYRQAEVDFQQEYENIRREQIDEFVKDLQEVDDESDKLHTELAQLRAERNAAVEAAKRAEEIRNKNIFYKLQLLEEDYSEIKALREVGKILRNKEPLNKIIWKCYYEKPTTDLVGRVVGNKTVTGIYKITNLENQMCYVGQSVDVGSRFKQHIRRGLGAETPTRNKLYPAMDAFGVENFSFELIEECSADRLNEREQYWQDFFSAKSFGYSIK